MQYEIYHKLKIILNLNKLEQSMYKSINTLNLSLLSYLRNLLARFSHDWNLGTWQLSHSQTDYVDSLCLDCL